MSLPSSQELPLSQETFLYSWDGIPPGIREVLCNENFNALPGVSMEAIASLCANASYPAQQSSLPSLEDFPGFFNFTVNVPCSEVTSKSSQYVCSSMLKRLYVKMDTSCPFNFSAENMSELVETSCIRATIYFSSPENINDVVIRCVNHKHPDSEKGDHLFEHLLRSESQSAQYYKDLNTDRCSVVVPFEHPPMGQDFSTYVYKFTCFTSCSGGPNRRPMCIVFTLENKGQIMGRRKIDVRVCSCPFRDKTSDENKLIKGNTQENVVPKMTSSIRDMPASSESSLSDITNDCKPAGSLKRKRDEGDGKEYIIKVRNEECYKLLKGVKVWYEIVKMTQAKSNWIPSVTDVKNLLNALTSSESEDK